MTIANIVKLATCAAALAALSACGGGGAGGGSSGGGSSGGSSSGGGSSGGGSSGGGVGGSGSSGPDNSWLQFSPSTLDLTAYEEGAKVTIAVSSSKVVGEVFNAAIIDAKGVFTTDASLKVESDLKYTAKLNVAPNLVPGSYAGNLEVRLCRDAAIVCKDPIPGSPWLVPYNITVKASINLSSLKPLAGAGPWSTFQGNAMHSGFVQASLDPTQFSRRFRANAKLSDAVSDSGYVCGVSGSRDATNWTLTCLDESTGQPRWQTVLGYGYQVNPPALVDGKLFVTTTGQSNASLRVFSAINGQFLTKQDLTSQWDTYLAPTVLDGSVYTNSGTYGGVVKLDAVSGTLIWGTALPQNDFWTPAVLDGKVLAFVDNTFYEISASTGKVLAEVSNLSGPGGGGGAMGSAVVPDGATTAYVSRMGLGGINGGHVSKIDRTLAKAVWRVNAAVRSNPVVVGSTVYVRTSTDLEARSTSDGRLLWSWAAPAGFDLPYPSVAPLIVVGNHAFTNVADGTVAIDLSTRKVVWQDPASGALSVSPNGILYISSSSGLVAVNLR